MANYYTTRFNPLDWPPAGEMIPAGVLLTAQDLREHGLLCCPDAEIRAVEWEQASERWTYLTRYQVLCPHHPGAWIELRRSLDWISPNEYLLD